VNRAKDYRNQCGTGPQPRGAFGAVPPNLFWPKVLLFPENFLLKHTIKTKILPLEMYFSPKTLKPGYGPGLGGS